MASTYESGNEPSCCIKFGEFIDWLRTGQLLKDSPPRSKYVSKEVDIKMGDGVNVHRHLFATPGRYDGANFMNRPINLRKYGLSFSLDRVGRGTEPVWRRWYTETSMSVPCITTQPSLPLFETNMRLT